MSGSRRMPAVAVLVALLVGAWVVDTRVHRAGPDVTTDVQTPMGARSSARSSAWFCAGATATADGAATGTVTVANAGRRPLIGAITVIPNEGETKRLNITIPANGRGTVRLTDVLTAPYASALVELDGGAATVDLVAAGPLGETVTPCASNASTTWYFAEGVTTKDATEVLSLFNPFPEDAVVDLVFTTEEGEVTPQALTGLSVRGRGLTAINVGDHVQRRESVSTKITVRAGRLVTARLQTFDGSAGRKGMSLALGAAAVGDVWYFPEGYMFDGIAERFQIFNPSTREAQVQVELSLEQGQAEPILLTVPQEARVTLTANDEARIPKSIPHAVTVRSTNGVGVVAERVIDGQSPSGRTGLSITSGARVPARRWVAAAGAIDDGTEHWVALQNPGSQPVKVTIALLDEGNLVTPPSLRDLDLAGRQRREINLGEHLRKGPTALLLTANQPVVVERDVYKTKGPGLAMAPAIPLRD